MRNKFAGKCYRFGKKVEPGQGHFEKWNGVFRTQHADCAIQHRGTNHHYLMGKNKPAAVQ